MCNTLRTYIMWILILIAGWGVCARASEPLAVQRMSRLLMELKSSPEDIGLLSEAGWLYLDMADADGARKMALRLENAGCKHPDSVGAHFYSRIIKGYADVMSGKGRDAIETLKQAYYVAEANGMVREQAMAYNALGYCLISLDVNFSQGLDYYNEALSLAKEADDPALIVRILNNIAEAYLWRHDFSGVRFAEEAHAIAKKNDDKRGMLGATLLLAHYKTFSMDNVESIPSLLWTARSLHDQYGYVQDGEISLVDGRYAQSQGENEKALEIYNKVLSDHGDHLMPFLYARLLMYKGWTLISLERYAEAVDVCAEALAFARRNGFESLSMPLLSGISYCYEHLGRYREAYDYLKSYQNRVDSMWITEQGNDLAKMRVESLVRLNEAKLTRQQDELTSGRRHITVLMCIGCVLLVIILLLWHLYRRKEALIRSIVAREKESLVREKLLRQAVEQARSETTVADKGPSGTIGEDKTEDLMVRFNELMSEKRLYTDSSLTISSVTEMLHTNRTYLSQAINRTFGKSFPLVVAEYRVRAAIELMSDPACNLPFKAIAADVGFSSASAFFTTFRNVVGMTPSAYRSSQNQ